jgi:cytosine/uracil/thiamine/allantoin permease
MWVLQALVFWHGMSAIKRFIDIAGPAVYVVMLALAVWILSQTGFSGISFTLASKELTAGEQTWQMITATALVVSYFSGHCSTLATFRATARACRKFVAATAGVCRLTSCCSPS